MINRDATKLSIAQGNRLDQIDDEDPGAKVIGWDFQGLGPLVLHSDGRRRVVNPVGRILPRRIQEDIAREELAA